MDVIKILRTYTEGNATLDETNDRLKEADAGFHLDLARRALTNDELAATFVSDDPGQVRGFGLLVTGTGSLDKVEVQAGKLIGMDCGAMPADLIIGGRIYHVVKDQLI